MFAALSFSGCVSFWRGNFQSFKSAVHSEAIHLRRCLEKPWLGSAGFRQLTGASSDSRRGSGLQALPAQGGSLPASPSREYCRELRGGSQSLLAPWGGG